MRKLFALVIPPAFAMLVLGGCIVANQPYNAIAPGIWRGVLELDKINYAVHSKDTVFNIIEDYKEGELPFNFEVHYTDADHFYIEIINGSERIRCDSIGFGHNIRTARDTIRINFPEYQSYIWADVRGGDMQGEWVVTTKENYRIPFYAKAGRDFRFTALHEKPLTDLSGNWATLFNPDSEDPEKAVGEFKQEGNKLTGTFRTETGDYRYLEGTVQGRKFWMSCFDGAHAFLFSGVIAADSLQGEFRSGTHYQTLWTAWRDQKFELGNPDSLTSLRTDAQPLRFDLTTPEGKRVQYPGADFEGKVKIFTISGTWCPNCRDEQVFLVNYLKKHPEQAEHLKIVAFSFERGEDIGKANAQLVRYKNHLGIPFDLVYAGKADTKSAAALFPALNKVMAFPTMIIIDKSGKIRRIHTGFDGPATSKYAEFLQDFEQLMQELTQS